MFWRGAEESRAAAEKNFDRAREAVRKMLAQVGDEKLQNVPQPVREKLLEEALKLYESFQDERPSDRSVLREMAMVKYQVANVYQT